MKLLAHVRTDRVRKCSIPAFREWYTSLGRYLWARGGARCSFAAEIVLCTIRGTPHSHLPLKCKQPRHYLLILLAPYRSRTLGRWAPGEAKFSTYCRRHRGGLSGPSPRKMARKRMRKTKSFDIDMLQTPNRRHQRSHTHCRPRHHTMNSNARSWWFGLVRSHLTHTSLDSYWTLTGRPQSRTTFINS